jgi:hypothetical protein
MPGSLEDFRGACTAMAKACGHNTAEMIAVLADHMAETIEQQDTCIDVIAGGVYAGQKRTRDDAVVETQTWKLAFSEEGKKFAIEHGWKGNRLQFIEWLGKNYPLKYKSDPITSWQKQVTKLRAREDPHAALTHYHSFMTESASLREEILETAMYAEMEIDRLIDEACGR